MNDQEEGQKHPFSPNIGHKHGKSVPVHLRLQQDLDKKFKEIENLRLQYEGTHSFSPKVDAKYKHKPISNMLRLYFQEMKEMNKRFSYEKEYTFQPNSKGYYSHNKRSRSCANIQDSEEFTFRPSINSYNLPKRRWSNKWTSFSMVDQKRRDRNIQNNQRRYYQQFAFKPQINEISNIIGNSLPRKPHKCVHFDDKMKENPKKKALSFTGRVYNNCKKDSFQERALEEFKEMEECTFRPSIKRNYKYKNAPKENSKENLGYSELSYKRNQSRILDTLKLVFS